MARATGIGFWEFQKRFGNETACRAYLCEQRFPNGFVCPKCGHTEAYFVSTRHLFQCKQCRKQVSLTAGTVMHRTHLPLTVWFWAMYLCANDKRGISATQLSVTLEICYESAWYLLRRIRSAMGQRDCNYKLCGLVEMDDAYLGGAKQGGKRGRGTERTKMVVGLSKTSDGKPKYLHMALVDDLKRETLTAFAQKHLAEKTVIHADGLKSYAELADFVCKQENFSPDAEHLKWLHKAISNLKAFIKGTYHGRCTMLQDYLDEFCFRFNRRHFSHELFPRLVRAAATSCGLLC